MQIIGDDFVKKSSTKTRKRRAWKKVKWTWWNKDIYGKYKSYKQSK